MPSTRDVSAVKLPENLFWAKGEFDECPYCHRLTPRPYAMIAGRLQRFFPYPCDCEGAKDAREPKARRAPEPVPARFADAIDGIYADGYADAVREGTGLYFWGGFGCGKTAMCHAIKAVLERDGWRVEMTTVQEIVSRVSDTYSTDDTQGRLFASLSGCNLLIIDDLGQGVQTENTVSTLWRVVNARYERKRPIVVTSNWSRGEIVGRLAEGNPRTAESIASRLCEMTVPVHCDSRDRRLDG